VNSPVASWFCCLLSRVLFVSAIGPLAIKKTKTWSDMKNKWRRNLTHVTTVSIWKDSFRIAALCGNRGAVNNALQTAGATEALWFLPVVLPTSLSLWVFEIQMIQNDKNCRCISFIAHLRLVLCTSDKSWADLKVEPGRAR
jgi:hypothetical protein